MKREGSSSRTALLPSLRWTNAGYGEPITVTLDQRDLQLLRRSLEGRLPFGRDLTARGQHGHEVLFQAAELPGTSRVGQRLTLFVTRALLHEMLATLRPEPGAYHWSVLDGIVVRVLNTP